MRFISYRAKLRLRKIIKITLLALAAVSVCAVVGFVYLQRYLVYTPDGVHIDFSQSQDPLNPELCSTTDADDVPAVSIIYDEANLDITDDEVFTGYYIDITMLQDPDSVYAAIQELEGPGVVMIDLKSSSGMFYYSTGITGAALAEIDVTTVDAIIAHLRTHGFTVIARVEAFRDRAYALEHISSGLAISGGALWSDEGYYWLDPGENLVLDYLQQIAKELSSRGITEIVFDDFYFPDSSLIVYEHEISRTDLINQAAASLISSFESTNITISFGNTASDFVLTQNKSHVVIDDVDASKINSLLAAYTGLSKPETQLVFLTNSKDTRFDGYNLLRPLLQN